MLIETYRGVVHPWLCDALGHFTTRHYTGWFDDASFHLLASVDGDQGPEPGLSWADLRVTNEYLAELHAGSLVRIRSGFTSLGRSSIGMYHEMVTIHGDEVAARCWAKSVRFDLERRKSSPISDPLRARIETRVDPSLGEPA